MRCIDKQGRPFEVKPYSPGDYAFLETMYTTFYPKGKFQGMPPLKDEVSRKWVKGLLKNGENFLAWQDNTAVGHAVLLPDFAKGDTEYLIFVSHPKRGRGIGSQLTRAAIEHVRQLGLASIWLTVGATNFRAIGLYKKFGFTYANTSITETERKMTLNL